MAGPTLILLLKYQNTARVSHHGDHHASPSRETLMQELDLHQPQQSPAGPVVWILTKGELYSGGGHILGVYTHKHLAKNDFLTAVAGIPFSIDKAWQDDNDGAVHVEGGCDFVDLEPHQLVTREQIDV
jgi:hypothetical protein